LPRPCQPDVGAAASAESPLAGWLKRWRPGATPCCPASYGPIRRRRSRTERTRRARARPRGRERDRLTGRVGRRERQTE
jgi:hypothetical protein